MSTDGEVKRSPKQIDDSIQSKKLRELKCKKCSFTCESKTELWDHVRIHIHPSKQLNCSMCNFVTEFKHHLEYHNKNHTGIKPFKCDKCPYECNNKSMLTSHKKSHSQVYQYHCQDCNYATKYCHQLKLHCKRFTHKPAMVLNPDGTPNPYPVIDVYGTKRGPKMKQEQPTPSQPTMPINIKPPMPNSFQTPVISPPMPFVLPFSNEMLPLISLYCRYLHETRLTMSMAANIPPPPPLPRTPSPVEDFEEEVLDLRKPEKKARESLENNNNNVCPENECAPPKESKTLLHEQISKNSDK